MDIIDELLLICEAKDSLQGIEVTGICATAIAMECRVSKLFLSRSYFSSILPNRAAAFAESARASLRFILIP